MSTAAKPQPTATKINKPHTEQTLLFDKENYMWMIGGIALIFIGFLLMSGGKSPDPHQFNYDEIYSFRRITLAPIVIMLGFIVEAYAIMKKPKDATPE
jgi:hypothetical protein